MRKSVIISISLISAILAFTGKDAFIITSLSDAGMISKDKIRVLMNISFFTSIIFPLIIAPAQLITLQKKNDRLENILTKQFRQLKNSLTVTFREVLQQPHATFNIRIFVPLRGRKKLFSRTIKQEKYFIIRNV